MSFTLYDVAVPTFNRMLNNLSAWLSKAEESAIARKYEPKNLLQMRLAPDMLPFVRQVQIACDTAKFCVARVTGVESPKHEDDEQTFAELKARIEKTLAFVNSVGADKFQGAETREVTWPLRGQPQTRPGQVYFLTHALPNFYFHLTTAYALLRNNGIDLGKADFLRGPSLS